MDDTSATIVGVAIVLAIPITFMVANWVRKNVEHGEARFDENGKMIDDE